MSTARFLRILIALLVVIAASGCDYEPPVPLGGRRWVLPVTNHSPRPATLIVAEDGPFGAGRAVGTVTPSVVLPGATVEVTFGVPPGTGWAIFVNPGPNMGPLLLPSDLPEATGIEIDREGNPGWMGGG
jgi:hypothetical protein